MKKAKSSTKFLIFIAVLFILAVLFSLHFIKGNKDADYDDAKIKTNISTIATFDYSKVTTVEAEVKKLDREYGHCKKNKKRGL